MSDDLRDLYQEVILDHGKNPRNFGHPAAANRSAKGHNPLCGDQLTIHLAVEDDGRVADAAFEGRGCAISMASASLMTEVLKGKSAEQAQTLFDAFHALATGAAAPAPNPDLEAEVERLEVLGGVRQYPMRVKCATLAWHTMVAALTGTDQQNNTPHKQK
jgi:nitrogen fixation NifU-like protein